LHILLFCFEKTNAIYRFIFFMNFQILARFSPLLLGGSGEELINFLKDDNEIIKEGALHVLAKAGGTIREQLAESSRCVA
jgi:hypothetical protein